jgi:AhpD family alkylhydroperoxidase
LRGIFTPAQDNYVIRAMRHQEGIDRIMESRLDYQQIAPGAVHAMLALETYVRQSGLERSLLHLIKTRASQINGCAYCLEMHTREARADGESEERLYLLDAWRESPATTSANAQRAPGPKR